MAEPIVFVNDGKVIYPNVIPESVVTDSVKEVFDAWCLEMGLSNSTNQAPSAVADDGIQTVNCGKLFAAHDENILVGISSEGIVYFYPESSSATEGTSNQSHSYSTHDLTSSSRHYASTNTVPYITLYAKSPTWDGRLDSGSVIQYGDRYFVAYLKYRHYSNDRSDITVSIRVTPQKLTVVFSRDTYTVGNEPNISTYLEISSWAEGRVWGGDTEPEQRNYFKKVDYGDDSVYSIGWQLGAERLITGKVFDSDGVPATRSVHLFSQESLTKIETLQSDENGDFSFTVYSDDEHFIVCFDEGESPENALIFDRVVGVEVES